MTVIACECEYTDRNKGYIQSFISITKWILFQKRISIFMVQAMFMLCSHNGGDRVK